MIIGSSCPSSALPDGCPSDAFRARLPSWDAKGLLSSPEITNSSTIMVSLEHAAMDSNKADDTVPTQTLADVIFEAFYYSTFTQ
jgi:hypothetical protein